MHFTCPTCAFKDDFIKMRAREMSFTDKGLFQGLSEKKFVTVNKQGAMFWPIQILTDDWGASSQIYYVLKPDPRFMSVAKNFKWLKPWLESSGWQLGLEVVLIDVLDTPLYLSKKTVFGLKSALAIPLSIL